MERAAGKGDAEETENQVQMTKDRCCVKMGYTTYLIYTSNRD